MAGEAATPKRGGAAGGKRPPSEKIAIRAPRGFHALAQRALGLRMARAAKRVALGELLYELLERDVAANSEAAS